MSTTLELQHGCEVCHQLFPDSTLIIIDGTNYHGWKRVFPSYICQECAKRISDALKKRE